MTQPRILIVEDHPVVRRDLARTLARLGYAVAATASTAAEAIEQAAATRPNLVLMDITLQGEPDGVVAAERIRQVEPVPIVFLTAHSDEATLQRARDTSPYGYLLKPFKERDLRVTVETALRRFQIDRQLTEKHHWLLALLGSLGDAVIATDSEGRVAYLNQPASRLVRCSLADAPGQDWSAVCCQTDRAGGQPLVGVIRQVLASGQAAADPPGTLIGPEGGAWTAEWTAAPLLEGQQPPSGAVLVVRDVSERQRLSETLLQLQKMEAVGRLAGGVAHDFNNLLTVILGNCEYLRQTDVDRTTLNGTLAEIENAACRAAEVTRQLLAFSRRSVLVPRVLEVNDLLRRAREAVERLLGKPARWISSPGGESIAVEGDPELLEQALIDLLMHAREASKDGSVRLDMTTSTTLPPSLDAADGARAWVEIRIEDDGPSLSAEALAHLFEPYASSDLRRVAAGLGLASAYGIIKQHGGHLDVCRGATRGTCFCLTLPRSTSPPPATVPMAPAREDTTRTILVVEDEPTVLAIIRHALSAVGYSVLTATSSDEALNLSDQHAGPIDLLISDVVMPGLNGPQVYEELARRRPGLPVLFVSGYTEGALEDLGLGISGVDLLLKPFTLQHLRDRVATVLAPTDS